MLITVIVFCEELEQMDNNVDQTLIIGVLSKLLPFLVNDKGEKSYGDREKLTDTKEKWRETRTVYFLSDNRFVRANITRRRNSTSVCEIGLTDFSVMILPQVSLDVQPVVSCFKTIALVALVCSVR